MSPNPWLLYLVTHRYPGVSDEKFLDIIHQALDGGVTCVQLREKESDKETILKLGEGLLKLVDQYQVPLLINDYIDCSHKLGAHGVHLGQSDSSVGEARKILGKEALIGLSVETLDQALEAQNLDINYIAASPIFSTPTKLDTKSPWGIEGIKKLKSISKLPIIGIGGINLENAESLMNAGLSGVAVVSAIINADNPKQIASELLLEIKNNLI